MSTEVTARALIAKLANNIDYRGHSLEVLAKDRKALDEACGNGAGSTPVYVMTTNPDGSRQLEVNRANNADNITQIGIACDSHNQTFCELPAVIRKQLVPGTYSAGAMGMLEAEKKGSYLKDTVALVPTRTEVDPAFRAAAAALQRTEYLLVVDRSMGPIPGYPVEFARVCKQSDPGAQKAKVVKTSDGSTKEIWVKMTGEAPTLRKEAIKALLSIVMSIRANEGASNAIENLAAAAGQFQQHRTMADLYSRDAMHELPNASDAELPAYARAPEHHRSYDEWMSAQNKGHY